MQIDLSICRFFKCLPTDNKFKDLSIYQKLLLFDLIVEERNDNTELITNCFDALKPWLDKDMFFSMKEEAEKVRVNANYGKGLSGRDFGGDEEMSGDEIIIED